MPKIWKKFPSILPSLFSIVPNCNFKLINSFIFYGRKWMTKKFGGWLTKSFFLKMPWWKHAPQNNNNNKKIGDFLLISIYFSKVGKGK